MQLMVDTAKIRTRVQAAPNLLVLCTYKAAWETTPFMGRGRGGRTKFHS